jgi:hypothetical protein
MATKLTLSVDPRIVLRAKRFAKRQGVSVSRLVENYLAAVSEVPVEDALPPLVSSLVGKLEGAKPEDYRKYLVRKYL